MLKHIQQQFENALFNPSEEALSFIHSHHAAERLNIYRQTVIENCRRALEITYPGIWQLIGQDCANQVARKYAYDLNHVPQTGCLEDWGEGFGAFLALQPALQALPYLADFAHLEWAKQCALSAREAPIITIDALKAYTQKEQVALQFHFHPCVQLRSSSYPLQAIEYLINHPDSPHVELNQGPSWALVVRQHYQVQTYWLKESEWQFIALLKKGITLIDAVTKLEAILDHIDLPKTIYLLFNTSSLSNLTLGVTHE